MHIIDLFNDKLQCLFQQISIKYNIICIVNIKYVILTFDMILIGFVIILQQVYMLKQYILKLGTSIIM